MAKIYLCGHTGSVNRGCEAIIRSTVKILQDLGENDINLITFNIEDDKRMGLDKIVNVLPYPKMNVFEKAYNYMQRRLFKNNKWYAERIYKKLFKSIKPGDICFNIGGDTYCYGTPYLSYALNDVAKNKGVSNIFWGCTIEEDTARRKEMVEDLNKYRYIAVREKLSEQIFNNCIEDKKKIMKICDPAFHLETIQVDLPKNFIENNTLGINISPMVISKVDDTSDMVYQNVFELINYVIEKTDMNICLIPHVYNVEKCLEDYKTHQKIYERYKNCDRVSIVDKELSCTQLKYLISKCRFFIGARTHTTIAAYSSGVPCLALSYSLKSRGIATDLFGTDKGYTLAYKEIKNAERLRDLFIETLLDREDEIRNIYREKLPAYKQSVLEATSKMLRSLDFERKEGQVD